LKRRSITTVGPAGPGSTEKYRNCLEVNVIHSLKTVTNRDGSDVILI